MIKKNQDQIRIKERLNLGVFVSVSIFFFSKIPKTQSKRRFLAGISRTLYYQL